MCKTREQIKADRRRTVIEWVVFISILIVSAGLPNWWR